jgi:hypothetical protein
MDVNPTVIQAGRLNELIAAELLLKASNAWQPTTWSSSSSLSCSKDNDSALHA